MFGVTTSGFDEPLFPELVQTLNGLSETLSETALNVAAKYEPLVQAIAEAPKARGDDTYIWSRNKKLNAKARGWWFWQLSLGNIPTDGKHYLRSGKAQQSFRIEVSQDIDGVGITIRNTWPDSIYVFGTFGNNKGKDTRNVTHAKDGWKYAYPEINMIFAAMDEVLLRQYWIDTGLIGT